MEELIPIVAIFFVIGVPVMSVAAHLVLRPLIRDLTGALRGGKADELDEIRERLSRLEGHLDLQGRQLAQLTEAERFRRQLESGRAAGLADPDPSARSGAPVPSDGPGTGDAF